MERNRGGRPRHPDVLTPAEWRVLEALREGGTNAEIGARLGISADAVKYHISNMLGKLELGDRRALAAWRPEERRGRLPAWFAVSAAIGAIARPVAWVGIGTVAAAGVAAAVVATVVAVAVVLVVVAGDGEPPTVARAPLPTPEATSPPPTPIGAKATSTPTPSPTAPASPTPTQSPTPTATPSPSPTPQPTPTPEPSGPVMRYDRFDSTGEVSTPGSYALLMPEGDGTRVVETYEQLRTESTVVRVHDVDGGGVSRAAVYDAIEAGQLMEWRRAEDCFVRFRVTRAPVVEPAPTYSEFAVHPETYAFQGCQSGALPTQTTPVEFTAASELPLEHLGGTSLADFAIVHGVRQLVPAGVLLPSGEAAPGSNVAVQPMRWRTLTPLADSVPHVNTGELDEARRLPYWREPRVPEGWRFAGARSGHYEDGLDGYAAAYVGPEGQLAVIITGAYASGIPMPADANWTVDDGKWLIVHELRVIAGRPATVMYSPLGPQHLSIAYVSVEVYDHATGAGYVIDGRSGSLGLRGGPEAVERLTEIARSLFEPPNPP